METRANPNKLPICNAVRLRYRLPSNGSMTACTPCFGHTNEILMPWSVSNGSGEQSAPHSGHVLYSASGSGSNTWPPNPRCLEQYRTDRSGAFRRRTRLPSLGPRCQWRQRSIPIRRARRQPRESRRAHTRRGSGRWEGGRSDVRQQSPPGVVPTT